jgi:hypothetical protein
MNDDELQKSVHAFPSKYPVEHERHEVAEVHYLHGGGHSVHVLFKAFG